MSYPLTRAAALLTAGYNIFALARPEALVSGLGGQVDIETSNRLARVWAGRDLPVAALVLWGPDSTKPLAVGLRVAADVSDAVSLGSTTTGPARRKALGVTLGWAALNVAALLIDRSRNSR